MSTGRRHSRTLAASSSMPSCRPATGPVAFRAYSQSSWALEKLLCRPASGAREPDAAARTR